MKTRILNEISKKVRFSSKKLTNGKTEYIVERKSRSTGEWEIIARTTRIERALSKKHNAWHSQIHLLNLGNRLLRRRKYGKHKWLWWEIN